ncbi:MAG: hypothetical protein ACI4XJ_01110 [Eubacteriales bacterium]
MPKKLKTLVSLLLVALMLASCSESTVTDETTGKTDSANANPSESQNETEEETEYKAFSEIKVEKYDGRALNLLASPNDERQIDIVVEELNGSALNDAIYQRNKAMEDIFDITMNCVANNDCYIGRVVDKNVLAGSMEYDFYFGNIVDDTVGYMLKGDFIDINKLEEVDLNNQWWDQTARTGLSIGNKNFIVTGDISPTSLLASEAILFNKQLFSNYGIEEPYDMVFEGTWTLDAMASLMDKMNIDLDGDGVINTEKDLLSYVGWSYDCCCALFYGAGGYYSQKDENDYPVISIDQEKVVNIFEKIGKITNHPNAFLGTGGATEHVQLFNIFNEGRAFLCGIQFWKVDLFLREMEDDYGILPEPKYDEAQAEYSTGLNDHVPMIIVPVNIAEADMPFVGKMIEAMGAYNFDNVTPIMYDVIAGSRNVRDEKSAEIVNIIIRNRAYDYELYMHSDFSASIILNNKCENVVSFIQSNEKVASKIMEKNVKALASIE